MGKIGREKKEKREGKWKCRERKMKKSGEMKEEERVRVTEEGRRERMNEKN